MTWLIPILIAMKGSHLADRADALAHTVAAERAATMQVPAELLLSIAFVESRYSVDSVSVLIDGVRSMGRRSTKRPRGRLSSLHCGTTQATAISWAHCIALRDLDLSYQTTADSLRAWLKATGGNMVRALAGYGCGWTASRTGTCRGYPGRVNRIRRQLEKAGEVNS